MKRYPFLWLCLALGIPGTTVAEAPDRWYDQDQVEAGATLFASHCASCHGAAAQATPDWRKAGADDRYPPPPLNGTAHAWHHPLPMLRRTIARGGAPVGGSMPAFGDSLDAAQIDAIIAWFQSLWPNRIYAAWLQRQAAVGPLPVAPKPVVKKPDGRDAITARLRRLVPGTSIGEPVETPVPGLLRTKVGADYVYLTADGRYGLLGSLIDLETGDNLTQAVQNRDNAERLAGFPTRDLIIFPAEGEQQAAITVFTDTSCPFCRKLHAEVPTLQRAGVAVRYVAFPRGGRRGSGYTALKKVWCSDDPRRAMDVAQGVLAGDSATGPTDCDAAAAVDAGYRFGIELGIEGTPALFLPDGRRVSGYRPAAQLLQQLKPQKQ